MTTIGTHDPRARAAVAAIHAGRHDDLRSLLDEHPELATARIGDDDPTGMSRTLLHVATDWPGHFPGVSATIGLLLAAGAEVDARFRGPHRETALHWAASSGDLDALVALLDAGADIDADGGVIAGGTPLRDATAFGLQHAARVLVARGASATAFDLATLGMTDAVLVALDERGPSSQDDLDHAFWAACHGGRLDTAEVLAGRGADIDRLPAWEELTPLDAAARSGAHDVVRWLHGRGARTSAELRDGV